MNSDFTLYELAPPLDLINTQSEIMNYDFTLNELAPPLDLINTQSIV